MANKLRIQSLTEQEERFLGRTPSDDADLPDLLEEDVWATVSGDTVPDDQQEWFEDRRRTPAGRSGESRRWVDSSGRRRVGGLSLAFEESGAGESVHRVVHQYCRNSTEGCRSAASSAPMNVPVWPKMMVRVDSQEWTTRGPAEAEVDLAGEEWMPPHEYLQARESATRCSNSVFEGVGRTLKGRDMSRVRNAVWSQTGFFG